MILKELIIINLIQKKVLKNYVFKDAGINLILGLKRCENDESNGVGKSDMVDSIRYILGRSRPSQFDNNILKEKDIFIVLKIQLEKEKTVYLGRRILEENKGYVLENKGLLLDISSWELKESDSYKLYIQDIIYKNDFKNENPSISSVMEYVIRDEKNGFNEIKLSDRKAYESYRILDFLCELPYNLERNIKTLKDQQRDFNKQLAVIKSMEDEILDLKVRKKRLEEEISELGRIIKDVDISSKFDVDGDKYKKYKKELNKVQGNIFELEFILKQYRQNILDLEEKVDKIRLVEGLEDFYDQIIGYFPEQLKKNYEEMKSFYEFMLDNRGSYFRDKIKEIEIELEYLYKEKLSLKSIIIETSKILKNTELVDDINNLSENLIDKNKELAEINIKIETYDKKTEINKNINKLKTEILRLNQENEKLLELYGDHKEFLEETFLKLVGIAYSEGEGFLKFEYDNKTTLNATTGRIKINCKIVDEKSHGRLYMKINLFDLTWFLGRIKNNSDIQFLIHDGSYCKPDPMVKQRVIDYIERCLQEYNRGQYFITANVDELTQDTIDNLRKSKSIVAELDREDDSKNRFFGFKYQNM